MVNTNRTVLICVVLLCAFAVYKVSSGDAPIIEYFWGLPNLIVDVDRVGKSGYSEPRNNQSSLGWDPNPYVNTMMMSTPDKELLMSSLAPPGSAARDKYLSAMQLPAQSRFSNDSAEFYSGCGGGPMTDNTTGPPVYTVPGTYQSALSPRFNSEGYNSYVKYSLPEEKYLGNRPNDPLMMADVVERPVIREEYTGSSKFSGNTPYEFNEIYDKQKKQGDEVASKLPVPTMGSGQSKDLPSSFWQADRFIFKLQRSRLFGAGDPIRGDLPCVPCSSSPNPADNVWFRPSVNVARDLRAGAINVMSGAGNPTALQTSQLQISATGGAKDTFGGVALAVPQNTPVGNILAAQQAQVNRLNMGNQIQLTADVQQPLSSVSTTSFP